MDSEVRALTLFPSVSGATGNHSIINPLCSTLLMLLPPGGLLRLRWHVASLPFRKELYQLHFFWEPAGLDCVVARLLHAYK